MTNKEAIEILKGIYPDGAYSPTEEQRIEAINMAISALSTTPEDTKGNFHDISNDFQKDFDEEVHNYRMQHGYPEDEDELFSFAYHFADWQLQNMKEAIRTEYEKGRYDMREEMMKEAVDGEVVGFGPNINGSVYDKTQKRLTASYSANNVPYCEIGDKVKLIIVKEG